MWFVKYFELKNMKKQKSNPQLGFTCKLFGNN